MGSITTRKRKDGSHSYRARVRVMRGGTVYHETKTFDRRPAATTWIMKREKELAKAPTPFPLEALEAELLRTLAGSSRADRQEPAFARLTAVLWDRLERPAPAPTLPMPADPPRQAPERM